MKISYRPEIDSLRAIAVASVIFYHLSFNLFGKNFFSGGFLGVDIFFVISGYLIGSIVLKEILLNKNFSYSNFYERRIRRLIPILFIIILLTIILSYYFLLPEDYIDFTQSALSSIFFISNFFFHLTGKTYGADNTHESLLHTWSLSIEEQFYIIFPIITIFLIKFFKRKLLEIFIFIFLISLILAQWGFQNHPSVNFYFIFTRAWELIAGIIIAILHLRGSSKINIQLQSFIYYLSFSIIIFSIFFFNEELKHPSLFTLPLILGTSLIIYLTPKKNVCYKILNFKPFIFIGLISYSLYLWHYPLIIYFEKLDFENTILNKFLLLLLIFILSVLSYYLIEKPFRNKNKINKKNLFFYLGTIFFVIIISCINIINNNGIKSRFVISENTNFNLDKKFYLNEWHKFRKENHYLNKLETNKNKILIVGNSHAVDTYNSFIQNTELFKNYEFSIIEPPYKLLGKNMYEVSCFYEFLVKNSSICKKVEFTNYIKTLYQRSDIIMISTRWKEKDIVLLPKIIKELKKDKKRILILNNTIELKKLKTIYKFNYLDHFVYLNKRLPNSSELKDIGRNVFNQIKNTNVTNAKLERISKENNVIYLKKENYLCDFREKNCFVITPESEKIMWDYGHLTLAGAKYLGEKIKKTNWLDLEN